jgi:hypothetical protein
LTETEPIVTKQESDNDSPSQDLTTRELVLVAIVCMFAAAVIITSLLAGS